jgi:hypothetical protein
VADDGAIEVTNEAVGHVRAASSEELLEGGDVGFVVSLDISKCPHTGLVKEKHGVGIVFGQRPNRAGRAV